MPFPGRESDVIVLNSWADGNVNLTERRGTLASGKQRKARYAIDIKSEPLLMQLDGRDIGQGVAEAWAQRIRDNVLGIATPASKATQAMRAKGAAALARGERWAVKRYAGGRIGPMPPNQSDKLFNDSGRLAKGIHARANITDSTYTVNFPANRFNPALFGPGYQEMVDKFVKYVPMLDPRKALGDPAIEKAMRVAVSDTITKLTSNKEAEIARGLARLRAARMKVIAQAVKLAASAAGF